MKKLFVIFTFAILVLAGTGTASAGGSFDPETWGDDGDSLLEFDFPDLDTRLNSKIIQNAGNN